MIACIVYHLLLSVLIAGLIIAGLYYEVNYEIKKEVYNVRQNNISM